MIKFKQAITKMGKFLYKYKFTILTLIYFFLISWRIIDMGYNKPVFISAIALVLWLHLFSKAKLRVLFVSIFALIITINAYFAFVFGTPLTMGVLGSIIDTNVAEATSMSKDVLPLGIPLLLLSFTLIYLSTNELKKSTFPVKYTAIALVVYVLVVIPLFSYNYLRIRPTKIWHDLPEHPYVTFDELGLRVAPILYGNIVTAAHLIDEKRRFSRFFHTDEKILPEGVSFNIDAKTPNKIYYVLGESSTRLHYSLYGYNYPTTPNLDSISRIDSTFRYYNGISSAALTRDVLRTTLTYAVPHDLDRFYYYKTLIDLANEAGYETIWVAQESQYGKDSDAYINAIHRGAKETYINDSYCDLELIPLVEMATQPDKKQFILIHMAGSHIDYSEKYDKIDELALPGSYPAVHYDRTIHKTDRVLNLIYEIAMRDSSSLMMFYSDHGEEINVGHGYKKGRTQFKVPLIYTNNCGMNIDSIMPKYHYRADSQDVVGTVSTYFMAAEIMGYSVSDEAASKSAEESKYIYHSDGQVEPYENIREQ